MEQELHPHIDEAVRDVRSSGASSWLSAFPLKYCCNKVEFNGAIQIIYRKDVKKITVECPCGQKFDVK